MKTLYKYLIITCSCILATGCIRENLDSCKNVEIKLIYKGDGAENILAEKVSQVTLYVFDKDENLVEERSYSQKDLINSHTVERFRLKPADYTVVALANNLSRTKVITENANGIEEIIFTHPEGVNETHTGHDANYIGSASFTVPDMGNVYPEVILSSAHTDVMVEVTNTGTQTRSDNYYTVVFRNIPNETGFDNTTTENTADYQPQLVYNSQDNKLACEDFNLFRLEDRKDISIDLLAEGNVIYSVTLDKFLQDNPSVDITKEESVLPIAFEITPVGVEVTIPEWFIVDVEPEL